jgi:hypothetical protein
MNYSYLLLVVPGLVLTMAGFMTTGRKKPGPVVSGLMFLVGVSVLVLGVLLTCVPDFFA